MALNGVTVCCTGISLSERNQIHSLVDGMGGKWSRNFTESVTHVIAKTFSYSEKLTVALSLSLPIISTAWIFDTAALCKANNEGNGASIDGLKNVAQYYLKPLHNFIICVTGIDPEKRTEIASLVTAHGGTYSPDLTRAVTHLITADNVKVSKKLEYALKWNIIVVNANWIYDKVKKVLKKDSEYAIDEIQQPVLKKDPNLSHNPLIQMDIQLRSYFDSFVFCISTDIAGDLHSLLKKIILEAGGIRSTNLDTNCTHFICKERLPSPSEKRIISQNFSENEKMPIIVCHEWILDCNDCGCVLPTVTYSVVDDILQPEKIQSRQIEYKEEKIKHADSITEQIFADFDCAIVGFNAENTALMTDKISSNGGKIVSKTRAKVCISPFICSRRRANASVQYLSPFWITECIHSNRLISSSSSPFFKSYALSLPFPKAASFTVSVTGFEEFERNALKFFLVEMGAKFTDQFSKRNNLLICREPSGQKYEKAVQWRIPNVKINWIYDMLQKGTFLDIDEYVMNFEVLRRKEKDERATNVSKTDIPVESAESSSVIESIWSKGKAKRMAAVASSSNVSLIVPKTEPETFKPQFKLDNLLTEVTPALKKARKADLSPISSSLDLAFSRNLAAAAQNIELKAILPKDNTAKPALTIKAASGSILAGVKAVVSSRFTHRRPYLHEKLSSLGASYSTTIDSTCTHYLHTSSRLHETYREFKQAKTAGLIIVAICWVDACVEAGCRVNEKEYPHIYDPSIALPVVSSTSANSSFTSTHSGNRRYATRRSETPDSIDKTANISLELIHMKHSIENKENDGSRNNNICFWNELKSHLSNADLSKSASQIKADLSSTPTLPAYLSSKMPTKNDSSMIYGKAAEHVSADDESVSFCDSETVIEKKRFIQLLSGGGGGDGGGNKNNSDDDLSALAF